MFMYSLILTLVWVVLAVLNFWIWNKSKAQGNLIMLVGAAVVAVFALLMMLGAGVGEAGMWLSVLGQAAFAVGFFLSVRPMVEAQLAALKEKVKSATSEKSDAGDGADSADAGDS